MKGKGDCLHNACCCLLPADALLLLQRRRGKNQKKEALDELEARCRLTSTVLLYFCSSINVTLHYSTTILLKIVLCDCIPAVLLYLVDSSTKLGAHPHFILIVHLNMDGTECLPAPSSHPQWQHVTANHKL